MDRRLLQDSKTRSELHGTDQGSASGKDLCERPSSEGRGRDVEPIKGQSWGPDSFETNQLRRMYRDVIIGAVHDLGYGAPGPVAKVHLWRKASSFPVCCELAQWDEDWVDDLLISVSSLPSSVRRPITRQCIDMLKAVARLDATRVGEVVNMPLAPPRHTYGHGFTYRTNKLQGNDQ